MIVDHPHKRFRSSNNPNKVERNFYKVWSEMNRRCRQKTSKRNNESYFNKGVQVCDRWKSFDYFFIDMWESYLFHREVFDNDTELDRINVAGDYYKNNCRWATRLENMNNTSNVRRIRGKTLTEWSKIVGVSRDTLSRRLEQGWSDDKILYHPFGSKPRKNKLIN